MSDEHHNYPFDPVRLRELMGAQEAKRRKDFLCDSQIAELQDEVDRYREWLAEWKDYKAGKRDTEPDFYTKYPNG